MDILQLIRRKKSLFQEDFKRYGSELKHNVASSSFLVLGGAGSIGQAITKEIFKRNPKKLHVVDISENNLVELVRDIRSSFGYIEGEFRTFALDIASWQFDAYTNTQTDFDYVLNLTALKHVRSEKDPFTLMRMIETNILNSLKITSWAKEIGSKKYFAVSTDKAANPVNMMGATKRIMELFLMLDSEKINISTARFANVAFSDGSLLHSFKQRLAKRQPIVAPNDVKRYFVTPQEAGAICLFSTVLGKNRDVFFPILGDEHLIKFTDIAMSYLKYAGYEPYLVSSEDEARNKIEELTSAGQWPCLFAPSNTTGEKTFEEFYTKDEEPDFVSFQDFGVINSKLKPEFEKLDNFLDSIYALKQKGQWSKEELIDLLLYVLPNFEHEEKGKNLDSKM
ncbi:MAG: UDP-N-acetylglucosamine 4,6-dehydratase [Balneolaceae bacterium]|nr:UDP-N-acetylglucosamine 4,6-dehydratase [Balneolaceae bacterium]